MADPADPEPGQTDRGTDEPAQRPAPTGMPRWVKVFGGILLALVLLLAIGKVTGLGGDHGPGRHGGGDSQEDGDTGGHDPSDWDH